VKVSSQCRHVAENPKHRQRVLCRGIQKVRDVNTCVRLRRGRLFVLGAYASFAK
jgi:hypothetical protein